MKPSFPTSSTPLEAYLHDNMIYYIFHIISNCIGISPRTGYFF